MVRDVLPAAAAAVEALCGVRQLRLSLRPPLSLDGDVYWGAELSLFLSVSGVDLCGLFVFRWCLTA